MPGTAEICEELGLRHVPDVATNVAGHTAAQRHVHHRPGSWRPTRWCVGRTPTSSSPPTIMQAAQVVTDRPRPAYLVGRRTDRRSARAARLLATTWSERARRPRAAGRRAQAGELDRLLHVHAGTLRRAPAVRDRTPGLRPVADLASRRSRRRRHRRDRLRARSPPTSRLLARRNPCRGVRRRRGAAERRHRRRLAALPLDRPRPAQARTRRSLGPARGVAYRLARPRTYAGHWLRFTRPLRRRMLGEQATRRRTAVADARVGSGP